MRLLRKDTPIDPRVQAELDAIDAALADEPAGAEHTELVSLARQLRDQRPQASERFEGELARRAEQGFRPAPESSRPAHGRSGGSLLMRLRPVALPLAAGCAAVAVLVAGVAGSGVFESSDHGQSVGQAPTAASEQRGQTAGDQALARKGKGATPSASILPGEPAPPTQPGERSNPVIPRQVERFASITLGAPTGKIEDVADEVVGITDKYRGFVSSSSVSGGDSSAAGATFELRIPAAQVQNAVSDLSRLGHVRERNQSTQDVTARSDSLRVRIARTSRRRGALLRQLATATTHNQTVAVKARLRSVERRLAQLRRAAKQLDNRVTYSAVSLRVVPDENAGGGGKFTPADALRDARDILAATLGAAVVGLAVAIPAAILLGLLWLASAPLRRRLRERGLDRSFPAADTAADGGETKRPLP